MEVQASNTLSQAGQAAFSAPAPVRPPTNNTSETTAVGTVAPEQQAANTKPASKAQLQEAVKAGNDFLKTVTNAVEFSLDKDSGETVVKVVDTSTKEVLRQFPSEEMLAIAKALDKIQGLLIKQKA